jgi:hypothetical protein
LKKAFTREQGKTKRPLFLGSMGVRLWGQVL